MAILHVRKVPGDLYKRIQALAREERRSMSAQVIRLLEEAVRQSERRRESMSVILERIRARREAIRLPGEWPGSLELLREDRAR